MRTPNPPPIRSAKEGTIRTWGTPATGTVGVSWSRSPLHTCFSSRPDSASSAREPPTDAPHCDGLSRLTRAHVPHVYNKQVAGTSDRLTGTRSGPARFTPPQLQLECHVWTVFRATCSDLLLGSSCCCCCCCMWYRVTLDYV